MRAYTKILLFSVYFAFYDFAQAQTPIKLQGIVYDAITNRQMPFVYVLINQDVMVGSTNLDGKFNFEINTSIERITFARVGYESFVYEVNTPEDLKPLQRYIKIPLLPKATQPASNILQSKKHCHYIIKQAVQNRHLHNPKKLPFYSYHTYSKFFIDLEPTKDVIFPDPKDTTKYKIALFLKYNHLFLAETITAYQFLAPAFQKEKIIANRVAGLQNPEFVAFGSQHQALNFYEDYFVFLKRKYLNPISEKSWEKYEFELQDTILVKPDTLFWIKFKPLPNKNFDGLKGRIAIHSRTYAIQSMEIESALSEKEAGLGFKIEQQYEWIDKQHWFPRQMRTELVLRRVKIGNRRVIAQWNTHFSDFDAKKKPSIWQFQDTSVEFDTAALHQNKELWATYRVDSLVKKELNTYVNLDTVGKKENFDTKLVALEALAFGRIPLNIKTQKGKIDKFDFDILNSFNFNRYEFIRLGMALQTNHKFSKQWTLGAHLAYGTKDGNFKYGFWTQYRPFKKIDATLTARYLNDVAEPARIGFLKENVGVVIAPNREFFIGRMDKIRRFELKAQARLLQNIRLGAIFRTQRILPTYAYSFQTRPLSNYQVTELSFQLQYFWGAQYVQMDNPRFLLHSTFPALSLSYTQGLRALGSGFRYGKWQARLRHEHTFRHIGTTQGELWLGTSSGEIPYSMLWNGQGTGMTVPPFIPNFFQTMGTYEFLTDKFIYVFLKHNFRKLLYKSPYKWLQPEPVLHHSFGWGNLRNPTAHTGDIEVNTLSRGYWESGFVINNLFKFKIKKAVKVGLGGGTFLRYGAYRNRENFGKNIAYKFALNIGI